MCTIYGVLLHFTIFCCQISFFCNLRCFVAKPVLVRFTRFCVEKNLAKNCARGEKMTNMRYAFTQCSHLLVFSLKKEEVILKMISMGRSEFWFNPGLV